MSSTPQRAGRGFAVAVATVGMLLLGSAPASAHGDTPLVDEAVVIPAGESARFSGDLHYHRLLARVSADGPVTVQLINTRSGVAAVSRGPADAIKINELVRCCDTRVWAPYELVLTNATGEDVTADVRAQLAHDDIAVMVLEAEGDVDMWIALIAAIAAIALLVAVLRKKDMSLRKASLTFTAVVAVLLAVAFYGMLRYGVAGAGTLVAGGYELSPIPINRYVPSASLTPFLAIVGWTWAAVRWAKARGSPSRAGWVALGCALIGATAVSAVLVATTYHATVIPAVLAVGVSTPVLAVMLLGLRARRERFARIA